MLIYIIVVSIIMGRGEPNFPVFVFSGLLIFRWSSNTIGQSTSSISSKKNIINNIYLPKTLFPFIKNNVNTFYFLISLALLIVLLVIYKIPPTWHYFEIIPVLVVQYLFNFGVSLWLSHLGIVFFDVDKILNVFLRAWYYLSPGLYALDRVPEEFRPFMWLNPLTTSIVSSRNVFLYGKSPVYLGLATWFLISVVLIYFGLRKVYQFDRSYAKVM